MSLIRALLRHPLLGTCAFAALVVALVHRFVPDSLPTEPRLRADRLAEAGFKEDARQIYWALLAKAPTDLELHRAYVEVVDPAEARPMYEGAVGRGAVEERDVAEYMLGYLALEKGEAPELALAHLSRVSNRDLPYLNNTLGRALLQLKQPREAEPHFRREIALGKNVEAAVSNLSVTLMDAGDPASLAMLVADPRVSPFVDLEARGWLSLRSGDLIGYLSYKYLPDYQRVLNSPIQTAEALLIACMWIIFLRRIDIFEREPIVHCLLVFGMGVVVSPMVFPLYDLWGAMDPLTKDAKDLAYFILHVGVIEELVKFLPVILFVRFSKQVNEPVDFLIYGSLSGLGFATLENVQYFAASASESPGNVFTRFLYCLVLHMFCTSIPCYEWARARNRGAGRVWPRALLGLAIAAVLHGLYDHFVKHESILTEIFVVVFAAIYGRMLANMLSISPFHHSQPSARASLVNFELIEATAVLVFLGPFVADAFALSPALAAERTTISDVLAGLVKTAVVFGVVGEIGLARGREGWLLEPDSSAWEATAPSLTQEWFRLLRAVSVVVALPILASLAVWEFRQRLWDGGVLVDHESFNIALGVASWLTGACGVLLVLAALPPAISLLKRDPSMALVREATPQALESVGRSLVEHGFVPAGLWRLKTSRLSQSTRILVLIDAEGSTFAIVRARWGVFRLCGELHLWSRLKGGNELRTSGGTAPEIVPVAPGSRLQVFRRASPETLLQRHREGLRWLVEQGVEPISATPDGFASEFLGSVALHRRALLREPVRRLVAIGLRRIGPVHLGSVSRQRFG